MICIYVGSSRSLNSYSIQQKKSDERVLEKESSLMSLKTALSIPVIATFTLLLGYFIVKQEWTIFNQILFAYFVFLSTMTLKKYLYMFMKTNPNF
jgi:small-conductance mechanosensitive channel